MPRRRLYGLMLEALKNYKDMDVFVQFDSINVKFVENLYSEMYTTI